MVIMVDKSKSLGFIFNTDYEIWSLSQNDSMINSAFSFSMIMILGMRELFSHLIASDCSDKPQDIEEDVDDVQV